MCSPPSCAARVPATAGWAGPIQSPDCVRLHSSAGVAVSQRPSTLSSPRPHFGAPAADPPGWRPPSAPQDLIQGGETSLQLAQQTLLVTLLCLECFVAGHGGLPRRFGLLMAGAGERKFRRQRIKRRLQVLPFPPRGPACSSSSLRRASRVLACSSCRPFTSARVWLSRPCNCPSCCCHCCWRWRARSSRSVAAARTLCWSVSNCSHCSRRADATSPCNVLSLSCSNWLTSWALSPSMRSPRACRLACQSRPSSLWCSCCCSRRAMACPPRKSVAGGSPARPAPPGGPPTG